METMCLSQGPSTSPLLRQAPGCCLWGAKPAISPASSQGKDWKQPRLQGWRAAGRMQQGKRSQHLARLLCWGERKSPSVGPGDGGPQGNSPKTGVC